MRKNDIILAILLVILIMTALVTTVIVILVNEDKQGSPTADTEVSTVDLPPHTTGVESVLFDDSQTESGTEPETARTQSGMIRLDPEEARDPARRNDPHIVGDVVIIPGMKEGTE